MSTEAETATATVLPFPGSKGDRRKSEDLWTAAVIERGYSVVPHLLLWGQARLGISPDEMNVLLQIISHRWNAAENPWMSKAKIAQRMGRAPRTVQRHLTSLEKKGLVERCERFKAHKGQDANGYAIGGLIGRLAELAPEFKRISELNKLRRSKVETPRPG